MFPFDNSKLACSIYQFVDENIILPILFMWLEHFFYNHMVVVIVSKATLLLLLSDPNRFQMLFPLHVVLLRMLGFLQFVLLTSGKLRHLEVHLLQGSYYQIVHHRIRNFVSIF